VVTGLVVVVVTVAPGTVDAVARTVVDGAGARDATDVAEPPPIVPTGTSGGRVCPGGGEVTITGVTNVPGVVGVPGVVSVGNPATVGRGAAVAIVVTVVAAEVSSSRWVEHPATAITLTSNPNLQCRNMPLLSDRCGRTLWGS
jgi:hypothetical protein